MYPLPGEGCTDLALALLPAMPAPLFVLDALSISFVVCSGAPTLPSSANLTDLPIFAVLTSTSAASCAAGTSATSLLGESDVGVPEDTAPDNPLSFFFGWRFRIPAGQPAFPWPVAFALLVPDAALTDGPFMGDTRSE